MKKTKPGSTALFPVPVVLVSCGVEKPNIISIAWVGTVSSAPPAVSIGVRPERFSHSLIADAGEFVINIPRSDQVQIVDYCGNVSGRSVDKWAACGLTAAPANKVRTPLIAECPVALECRVMHHLPLGAHDLFIGEVLSVQVDEEVLDVHGRLDHGRVDPLAYVGGFYWRLGEEIGRHGDWRAGIG